MIAIAIIEHTMLRTSQSSEDRELTGRGIIVIAVIEPITQ